MHSSILKIAPYLLRSFCLGSSIIFFSSLVDAFESELPPGEGETYVYAKTNKFVLYQEPLSSSTAIQDELIKIGEKIEYDKTIFRNVKPGNVRSRKEVTVEGRNFGNIKYLSHEIYYADDASYKKYTFGKDEVIEYLQYRAEGSCVVRWKGRKLTLEVYRT